MLQDVPSSSADGLEVKDAMVAWRCILHYKASKVSWASALNFFDLAAQISCCTGHASWDSSLSWHSIS